MTIRSRIDKLRTLQGIDAADPFHAPDTLPFRAVIVPVFAGSDPDVIEIDDATNVYELWPEVDTPCENPAAPHGQCHYNAVALEPDRCLYCGKITG